MTRSCRSPDGSTSCTISDNSLQGTLYARYRFSETLRTGVFAGYGRANYDFALSESDGFELDGEMTGKRRIYGWMLSGDLAIGNTVVTTDAVVGALAASVEATSDASSSLRDSKVILAARDDAASFVATAGELRGARLEAALRHLRSTVPSVATASDLQLAQAIVSL